MPNVSRATASKVADFPVAEDRRDDLDSFAVNFVTIKLDSDLAPALAELPGGMCQCPHWGYMFSGRMVATYDDGREEVYEAGDAFYMPPGHTPRAEAGAEFVQFSPADELAVTDAAIKAFAARMATQGA